MDSSNIKSAYPVANKPGSIGLLFMWLYKDKAKQLQIIYLAILKRIYHLFSLPYLTKTLFAPWKRDVEKVINPTIEDQIKVLVDNLISRLVGAVVRGATIISGSFILISSAIIGVAVLIVWYLLLWVVLISFFYGIYLIFS